MVFRFKVVQASKYLVIMLHDSKHMVEKLKHLKNTKTYRYLEILGKLTPFLVCFLNSDLLRVAKDTKYKNLFSSLK